MVKIILDEIQPLLIGRDAFNIEGCWQIMLKPSFNILRDRKLAMCAQACVDSALWDAVGKALGAPLYKLWGGYTDRLPSICIAGYYEEGKTLADFGREMEQIRSEGHAGCKFKVGGRTPREDAERVRVARTAAGEDFILIVDANQGWTLCARRSSSLGLPPSSIFAGSKSRYAGTTIVSIWPRRAIRPASRSAPDRARSVAPAAAI